MDSAFLHWGRSFFWAGIGANRDKGQLSGLGELVVGQTKQKNSIKLNISISQIWYETCCCYYYCCCSVAQLCLILCDPMDCSTPGFSVFHHLLEFAHISCPLSCPSESLTAAWETYSLSKIYPSIRDHLTMCFTFNHPKCSSPTGILSVDIQHLLFTSKH